MFWIYESECMRKWLNLKRNKVCVWASSECHTKPPRYSSDQYNIHTRLYEILWSNISSSSGWPSKGVKVCDSLVYDMKKLYGRLLVISLFNDYGGLRKSAKSTLVYTLTVYSEVAVVPNMDLIGGNERLYPVVWPKSATDWNHFHNFSKWRRITMWLLCLMDILRDLLKHMNITGE